MCGTHACMEVDAESLRGGALQHAHAPHVDLVYAALLHAWVHSKEQQRSAAENAAS